MRKEKLEELKTYIEELKVIKLEKQDLKGKFLKSEVYDCTLNNGEIIRREKLVKGNNDGSAAVILPVTKDNDVVLTVEPRVFTKRTVGVGVPAGYIEPSEEPIIAAKRELSEETGYVPENVISLGGFYQDMGVSSAYNRLFLAKGCEKKKDQHLDESEFIRYFTCTYDEALELIDMEYIQGCNAILTLTKAKKYMKGQ